MLDVVVLPCVPVTAIVGLQPRELAEQVGAVQLARRARARRARGCRAGSRSSTTTSAPSGTLAASWPIAGSMPAARSGAAYGEPAARSEPVTLAPSARATSARPLIPAPPMPDEVQRRPPQGVAVLIGRGT